MAGLPGWGTVCWADQSAASVVCAQLGYAGGSIRLPSDAFGAGRQAGAWEARRLLSLSWPFPLAACCTRLHRCCLSESIRAAVSLPADRPMTATILLALCSGPILLTDVACSGNETSLDSCEFSTETACDHDQVLGKVPGRCHQQRGKLHVLAEWQTPRGTPLCSQHLAGHGLTDCPSDCPCATAGYRRGLFSGCHCCC